jgi:glutaredoxin
MPSTMKAIVWSQPQCTYCTQAKALLEKYGIEYEERVVTQGYTKKDLFEAAPTARTVPQIFLDGEHIGGFRELKQYLAQTELTKENNE